MKSYAICCLQLWVWHCNRTKNRWEVGIYRFSADTETEIGIISKKKKKKLLLFIFFGDGNFFSNSLICSAYLIFAGFTSNGWNRFFSGIQSMFLKRILNVFLKYLSLYACHMHEISMFFFSKNFLHLNVWISWIYVCLF